MRPTSSAILAITATCALFGAAHAAQPAAEYPSRPVRLIVGFAPGGGTDTTARALAQRMSAELGQQFVVDNRPGAAGNIATELVARATPDGYTLLMGTIAALAINPSLYSKLPFDPLKDFIAISQAVNSTNVLVVHPSVAAKSAQELIGLARAKPGGFTFGSSGAGGAGHLAGELFNTMGKVSLLHVPYKGGGPVMVDLLAGQIQSVFATAATAIPHIKTGRIRPLGVTTIKRASMLPDIPTIAEQGLPGYDANNWYGLLAPARTPASVIALLNAQMVKALAVPEMREFLFNQGLDPAPTTPEGFAAYIKSEIGKWSKVIAASGAKAG